MRATSASCDRATQCQRKAATYLVEYPKVSCRLVGASRPVISLPTTRGWGARRVTTRCSSFMVETLRLGTRCLHSSVQWGSTRSPGKIDRLQIMRLRHQQRDWIIQEE